MAIIGDPDDDLSSQATDDNPRRGDVTSDYDAGEPEVGDTTWSPNLGEWIEIGDPDFKKVNGEWRRVTGLDDNEPDTSGGTTGASSGNDGDVSDTDTTEDNTSSEPDRYGSSPVGSGDIVTGVDEDTGEASQSIGGQGAGTVEPTESGDTTDVARVPLASAGTDMLEAVNQRVENATRGAAFGSTSVDDIGSGEALRNVPDAVETPLNRLRNAAGDRGLLWLGATAVGVTASVASLVAFWGDG